MHPEVKATYILTHNLIGVGLPDLVLGSKPHLRTYVQLVQKCRNFFGLAPDVHAQL